MATNHQKFVGLDLRLSSVDSDYFDMCTIDTSVYKKLTCPKSKKTTIKNFPWTALFAAANNIFPMTTDDLLALPIDKITIGGRICFKNSVFMKTASKSNNLPEFWKIVDAFLLDNGTI